MIYCNTVSSYINPLCCHAQPYHYRPHTEYDGKEMFSVCLFTGEPPQLGGCPRGTPPNWGGGGAPPGVPTGGAPPGVPPNRGHPGGYPPNWGGHPRGYPLNWGGTPNSNSQPPHWGGAPGGTPQLGGRPRGTPPPNLDKNVGLKLGQKMDKVLDKKWTKFWTKNWTNILETFGGGGRGRYASCGHAGGLSCCLTVNILSLN